MNQPMTCRFCSAAAVAVFTLSDGCFCFPDDREQALCLQHIVKATPSGTMDLKTVLDEPLWAWFQQQEAPRLTRRTALSTGVEFYLRVAPEGRC